MKNNVAKALLVIAILDFIFIFIMGILLGRTGETAIYQFYGDEYRFNWLHAIEVWGIGSFLGIFLIGMSQIVELLNTIALKTREVENTHPTEQNTED